MKQILLFFTFILTTNSLLQAQDRVIARGADPGELYLATFWYGIYSPSGSPYYDTLRLAVYRISNHGKNISIQYDVDYFSDYYTPPGSVMQPLYILTDATPGVLFAVRKYSKNYYTHTQLWVSFDYGKNWIFKEENIGVTDYISANIDGLIYRTGTNGTYQSDDYATTFMQIDNRQLNIKESGLEECEFFTIGINDFYYTNDCYQSCVNLTIDTEYASGGMLGFFPDVYRGVTEGEVFIHSWFPLYQFKVSFSADIAHTFRHVYVNDNYQWQNSLFDKNQLLFMSDREEGVFYILNLLQEQDVIPNGFHLKLCIHYYRDYGETLVDVYCHDINKNYVIETCEAVTDLTSEKPDNNSVLLTWTAPERDLTIEGYRVYRNHKLLTEQMIADTFYLDENLDYGIYEYNVLTYYTTGCISGSSNHVEEIIELEIINEICDEMTIYPNPTSSELTIDNGQLIINDIELFDIFGRKQNNFQFSIFNSQLKIDISPLQAGFYFFRISTEKGTKTQKIIKY